MKNLKHYKAITTILALIVFYPANAISGERSARTELIANIAVSFCLEEEGIITREQVAILTNRALKEKGISREQVSVLRQDKDFTEKVNSAIEKNGGCQKIARDFVKGINERRNMKNPR
jgi:hypothetical protein